MKVALIGRTNVGKSSLFNRLIGEKKAIVSPVPGTTRDRNFGAVSWEGMEFTLIDTGGLDIKQATTIERDVLRQAELAVEVADLVLLVLDLQTGLLPQDREIARKLKRQKKPFLIAVNKADSPRLRDRALAEFQLLGEEIFPVSAANGTGTGDLLDEIVKLLSLSPAFKKETDSRPDILTKIAIIGRPNVGKSSLLNAISGQDVVIVSDIPHTTREPQDTLITHNDNLILLIDTAGIRKKARVISGIERESVSRSLQTLQSADVAMLVLEADQPIMAQDKHLANELARAGVSLIIVFNKWDLLPVAERDVKKFRQKVAADLPFVRWAPMVFVSALTKRNVRNILDLALELKRERERTIDEDTLDKFLKVQIKRHKPTASRGPKPPRLLGLRQWGINPPSFEMIADHREIVPEAYVRYIENGLREKFGFTGTPIIIRVRGLKNR